MQFLEFIRVRKQDMRHHPDDISLIVTHGNTIDHKLVVVAKQR